jgi:aspartyl-tRNA(Asn)/glutamyl-tRNA(Gln) amidotransferase subunit A
MQIVGARHRDDLVLRAAHALYGAGGTSPGLRPGS